MSSQAVIDGGHPTQAHAEADGSSELQAWLLQQPRFARELLAGGVAGGLAKTCVAPLERTKILFQTGRVHNLGTLGTLTWLWNTEGMAGLFRGNMASVTRIVPYAAIHFGVYEYYRRAIVEHLVEPAAQQQRQQQQQQQGYDAAAAASSSGPAEAAATSEAAQTPPAVSVHGMAEASTSGSSIDVTSSTTTGVKDDDAAAARARQRQQHQEQASSSGRQQQQQPAHVHPVWDLISGSLAGATAVMLTYPMDLVRTRLAFVTNAVQPSGTSGAAGATGRTIAAAAAAAAAAGPQAGAPALAQPPPRHPSIHSMLAETTRAEGLKGLYRGVSPTLLGILPYAGLKFYVYQSLKHWYRQPAPAAAGQRQAAPTGPAASGRLPVPMMLLFGGVSGLVAQTATYPLDVIRRRMQVQGYINASGSGAPRPSVPAPTAVAAAAMKPAYSTISGAAAAAAVTSAATAPTVGSLAAAATTTTLSTGRAIIAEEGWMGLFRGLSINYMKVVPSTAIGFTVYDALKQYLHIQGSL